MAANTNDPGGLGPLNEALRPTAGRTSLAWCRAAIECAKAGIPGPWGDLRMPPAAMAAQEWLEHPADAVPAPAVPAKPIEKAPPKGLPVGREKAPPKGLPVARAANPADMMKAAPAPPPPRRPKAPEPPQRAAAGRQEPPPETSGDEKDENDENGKEKGPGSEAPEVLESTQALGRSPPSSPPGTPPPPQEWLEQLAASPLTTPKVWWRGRWQPPPEAWGWGRSAEEGRAPEADAAFPAVAPGAAAEASAAEPAFRCPQRRNPGNVPARTSRTEDDPFEPWPS